MNGYLHIGHAKNICLNFGVAEEYGGQTYLRFDDTNPVKEDEEFVEAIASDVAWLGFNWAELTHASDYFEQLYAYAVDLINADKAYVDSQSSEQIRETRGTLTEPGTDSPYRGRSVAENLDLFARMRAGEFADGDHVLRAKIDMSSPNINMRDPVIYRIRHVAHQRTGDAWCIPRCTTTCIACIGKHYALALYTGVRRSSAALRLGAGQYRTNFHPPQIEFSDWVWNTR